MRVAADSKVVFARVYYIGFFAVRVIGGEILFVNLYFNRLACALVKHVRFSITRKLHRRLFYTVLHVVFGIGLLKVNLNNLLARKVARIGNRNRNGIFTVARRNRKARIIEGGIGKPVAERIGNHFGIIEIPYVFRIQHNVLVTGFGIAIAVVNALLIHHIFGGLVGRSVGRGILVIPPICVHGVIKMLLPDRVGKLAGGVYLARKQIAYGVRSRRARLPYP